MHFTISRPPPKEKHCPVRRRPQHLPAQLVLTWASMRKNAFKKTQIWLGSRFKDYRLLQLKYDSEEMVYENKVADKLIMDIKGSYIHISLVLLLVDYLNKSSWILLPHEPFTVKLCKILVRTQVHPEIRLAPPATQSLLIEKKVICWCLVFTNSARHASLEASELKTIHQSVSVQTIKMQCLGSCSLSWT
jgi:hypothetical protein